MSGDDLQGLGVRSDQQLLFSRDGPGIIPQVKEGQIIAVRVQGPVLRNNPMRVLTLMALRTIMMASCSDRSVSSVNCSAPPLRMMVQVFALGQPLRKLYLQKQTGWNRSLSAKYCVATSPMGSLDRTTLAPDRWIFSRWSTRRPRWPDTPAGRWESSYLNIFDANLGVILLSLQLQLHVEQSNPWVVITFRLHLKPGVGESLLERNSRDHMGILAPPGTFLIPINLRGSRMSRDMTASTTILEKKHGDLLDLSDSEVGGGAEGSDDGLRVETLLHVRLELLQELSSQEAGDVHQGLGCRVNHIQQFQDGGSIIGDGIDVADELGNALRRVCPLLQQDNWCGLEREKGIKGIEKKA
ncbi:hypothetical protein F7725_004393, partial [Dissostichus mawsoni]